MSHYACWNCRNECGRKLPLGIDGRSLEMVHKKIGGGQAWAPDVDKESVHYVALLALFAHCDNALALALKFLDAANDCHSIGSKSLADAMKWHEVPWSTVARDFAAFPGLLARAAVFLCSPAAFDGAAEGRSCRPLLAELCGAEGPSEALLCEAREALADAKKAFKLKTGAVEKGLCEAGGAW